MEARELTLEEAALLAGVVLGASDASDREPPAEEPAEETEEPLAPPDLTTPEDPGGNATITVAAELAPAVTAFEAGPAGLSGDLSSPPHRQNLSPRSPA